MNRQDINDGPCVWGARSGGVPSCDWCRRIWH